MPVPIDETTPLTVALIGNPNTGKSTLFGVLVGIRQRVGNYPGVTVEKKTGQMEHASRLYEVIDLPGLYSLAPRSRDEVVAVDVLLGRMEDSAAPDAIVCIVDASNLQRNLYLVSQVLEIGLPTVLAVNMIDVAERQGVEIDLERLKQQMPIPVVAIQANRQIGIEQFKEVLAEAVTEHRREPLDLFPEPFQDEVTRLAALLEERSSGADGQDSLPRYLVERLLLDVNGYQEKMLSRGRATSLGEQLREARDRLADADCGVPSIETKVRYGWVKQMLDGAVDRPSHYPTTSTDRIDRVLAHSVWGTLLFAALMMIVFQSIFVGAEPLMGVIDSFIGICGNWLESRMAEGALRSLLVGGVIGGVGGVLVFLPQIAILFLFIAILEDCGYMARAACLMDRLMIPVGLSGKSFIPLLSSFACAVPGIMAARVIENERDRLTTILVAPLITCSARLPIYTLLIAAFIPSHTYLGGLLNLQGLTLGGLYLLGIVAAVLVALLLKSTILHGETPAFVMELPSYKWPSPRTILHRVAGRCWLFLRFAGTLILAVSVIVWATLYYPHNAEVVEAPFRPQQEQLRAELDTLASNGSQREAVEQQLDQLDRDILGAYQRQSLLGSAGRVIEPIVKPLGWDWRIGCAVIASFPAREIVVATLGVIYNLGENVDFESAEGSNRLRAKLHEATWDDSGEPVFNVPVALSILVFFALSAQCAATLAVIQRETNSWRWPVFVFTYMTLLAYYGAYVTYQLGTWASQYWEA
ncbi:MAG: ferrous iron transport protein B [Thermoguttaceae bacterium]